MMNDLRRELPSTILMIAILLLGAWYLFAESMDLYPAYIHAWTQTDRLALALNFQENGFDFFHPATFNLLTKDGITQVDFPIHDYLVALIGSVTETDLVQVFRWYTLCYALVGYFFLFRLALMIIKSPIRAVFATSFIFTLPYLVYYTNGFLPSVPSFANFLIGSFFIVKARLSDKRRSYVLGVFLLTLAALARAPFFIFLVALLLQQLWQQWKQRKVRWDALIPPFIGIIAFIAYAFYNRYLGSTYGSMFLSELLYFRSLDHFLDIMSIAADRWGKQLLSPFHALLFVALLIVAGREIAKKGMKNKLATSLVHYFLISAIGVLLFFFAFGQQFAAHDYYYIDSFLPLFTLLLILLLTHLKIPKKWYTPVAAVCILFFFYFFSYAQQIQNERYIPTYDDRIEYAYSVYNESTGDLANWGVKKEDTLLVLDANSTNMPFTLWGNRGYTTLNSAEKYVKGVLDSNFTYAILLDSFFISGSFQGYPNLIHQLERINGNGKLSLYRRSTNDDAADFFENLLFYGHSNFDGKSNLAEDIAQWTAKEKVDAEHGMSLKIEPSVEFPFTVAKKLEKINPNKAITLLFIADYFQKDTAKVRLVTSVNDYYGSQYTENQLEGLNEWQRLQYQYKVDPSFFAEDDELKFYFWNQEKDELFIDNIQLLIYQ